MTDGSRDRSVPENSVRGMGLVELERRFRRRARFIASAKKSRKLVAWMRDEWNQTHPHRIIRIAERPTFSELCEQQLYIDIKSGDFKFLQRGQEAQDFNDLWNHAKKMAFLLFPVMDYYWMGRVSQHPATAFCRHVIETDIFDPDLITLTAPEPLSLMNIVYENNYSITAEDEVTGESTLYQAFEGWGTGISPLYLPLHPGITEADIKRIARDIAEQANMHYHELSVPARIQWYHNRGMKPQKIANTLGLPLTTVKRYL